MLHCLNSAANTLHPCNDKTNKKRRKNMERFGGGYLEERKLVQRWPQPIPAIVALVVTLAVFYATWWIFQDPRGWL
jgi:hypothetical protein